MGRFAERVRAVGARRAAMLLAVAVLSAALSAAACTGERSEASVGPRTEAQQDSVTEPLDLTLSALEICETTRAQGYSGSRQWQNEDGDWVVESYSTGFDDVSETAVAWSVGGGTPPYTLVIDGETRDAEQTYEGPSGTASVSCAMQIGETFIDDNGQGRRYRTEPDVDSGLKTIRATVTDGGGATAGASVDVYVILELPGSDSILRRGRTYRVFGRLITAPARHDVQVGSVVEADCPDPATATARCGHSFSLRLVGADARISIFMTGDPEELREYATNGAWGAAAIEDELIEAAFDALIDSLDRRPSIERAGP